MKRSLTWILTCFVVLAGLVAPGCSSSDPEPGTAPPSADRSPAAQPASRSVTPPPRPKLDLPLEPIPSDRASGHVRGQDFVMNGADLRKNVLTLHGDGGLRYFVFLTLDDNQSPIGQSFEFVNAESGVAHVHVHYAEGNGWGVEKFPEGFTMRLELDEPEGLKVSGRIYLAVPDTSKSFIAGSFEAEILG